MKLKSIKDFTLYSFLLAILTFTSCSPKIISSYVVIEKGNFDIAYKDQIIKTPELIKFLKENDRPKIVLRTPNNNTNVTQNEGVEGFYTFFEREFLKNNFIVRDRTLLNKLLIENENINYSDIYDKIDTDFILEITSVETDFNEVNYKYPDGIDDLYQKNVNCKVSRIVCKLILVKNGQLAGHFELYSTCFDEFYNGKPIYYAEVKKDMYKRYKITDRRGFSYTYRNYEKIGIKKSYIGDPDNNYVTKGQVMANKLIQAISNED